MISQSELKYYSSLLLKKHRREEKKFLVEGEKFVEEGLKSNYDCEIIFITSSFNEKQINYISKSFYVRIEVLKKKDFNRLSDTVTPQGIIAVFKEKEQNFENIKFDDVIVALDNISDPGNAGTIIRNCDWFGIKNIFLSKDSVELYNPKLIRSSAGSLFNLNIFREVEPEIILSTLKSFDYQILVADLKGEDVYDFQFKKKTLLVFSNEANGPSEKFMKLADKKITIPKIGMVESLNVASASAVILSECQKKKFTTVQSR